VQPKRAGGSGLDRRFRVLLNYGIRRWAPGPSRGTLNSSGVRRPRWHGDQRLYGTRSPAPATIPKKSRRCASGRTDLRYTLTQNIFFKYGSRLVLIGNLVKKNDSVAHTVRFTRHADLDIDGTPDDDEVETAGGPVVVRAVNGVALTSLGNPTFVQTLGPVTAEDWGQSGGRSSCDHSFRPSEPRDWSAVMRHQATIAPGATVNFRVGYRLL
jgi:hypothetical protein